MKLTGKWMILEVLIMSETTQIHKDKHHIFVSFMNVIFESSDVCVLFEISKEVGKSQWAMGMNF